jgi:hypothetical protein
MAFPREIRAVEPERAPAGPSRTTPTVAAGSRRRRRATPVRRWAALAAVVAAALAACDPYVQGNGVFHQEDRSAGLAPFEGIQVEDGIQVDATERSGSAAQTVVVSGDANVIGQFRTEVRQETIGDVPTAVLHLFVAAEHFDSDNPLRAVVGANGLRLVRARDRSRVDVTDAAAALFVVDAGGGADVTLRAPLDATGVDRTLDVTADAAFVDAAAYPVEKARVAAGGGSHVELLAGEVSGTADATSRIDNAGGVCDVQGTTHLACCAAPGCP